MSKAFKSSEGMTKSGGQGVVPTSILGENRNWQMIVWRFDKWLKEQPKVPAKIKSEWLANIARY